MSGLLQSVDYPDSWSFNGQHTVAPKSDGSVAAWGNNSVAQLGDGTTTNRSSPVSVSGLAGAAAIAAGMYHSLALKSDGTVVAWGNNLQGQLGDGTTTNRTSPVAVTGLTAVAAIAAAGYQSIALKSDGTVVAWGLNNEGQLGDGTNTSRNSPVAVTGLTGVVAVAAAGRHSLALKSDGTVVTWGYNGYGQLGDGTTTNRNSPVVVSGLTGILAIAVGGGTSFALKSDGTVVAWGGNVYGRLGDGTTINRTSPVAVVGLSGVVAISGGYWHSVALKSDGTSVAWGNNSTGQLGDGTTTSHSSPGAIVPTIGATIATTSISPSSLTYAPQSVGTTSAAQTLTVTNISGATVYIPLIGTGGDFSRTTTCGLTLAANASCTISVSFTPTVTGARSGAIAIMGNGVVLHSVSLAGSGAGPMVTLGTTALTYAAQNMGSTSGAQSVLLSNTGSTSLSLTSIAASGDFAVTHNCGTGLAPGSFCGLNITFSPTAAGSRTGTVSITDDAYNSPQTISLSGTGLGGVAALSPTTLTFAGRSVGSTSAAQTVTLTNSGGAVLHIASILPSGDFAHTSTCATTLAAAASCSISVTFTPTAAGARGGSVVLTSDAASSPDSIILTGTGVAAPVVAFSPPSLTFENQAVGTTSSAMNVVLSNTGGAALTISSIGSSNSVFAVTHNCGGGLTAGSSCTLGMTFSPVALGSALSTLLVFSNAAGSPHAVSVSGTGVPLGVPVCTLTANHTTVAPNGSSTLTASCTNAPTSYSWTGGTCAGTTAATCAVTPAVTTTYSVTGTNGAGSGSGSATVTVISGTSRRSCFYFCLIDAATDLAATSFEPDVELLRCVYVHKTVSETNCLSFSALTHD
ncbi:MAG: choice-of-anchor D domain-containing protein [Burkholderiales bacterium]|nr:choice-of-anchor D domain-containing protein [Burkholderiales bacterium]